MPVVDTSKTSIGFQPMPPTKGVELTFQGFKNAKNDDGEDTTKLDFVVSDVGDGDQEHVGRKLSMYVTWNEKSAPFGLEAMVMLGADPKEVNNPLLDTDKVFAKLVGNTAKADVVISESRGRKFNNIRWAAGGGDSWDA